MFARGHNGRLASWPPGRKPRKEITPAKSSHRAKIQKVLFRAVRAKFRRRQKTPKPKRQRQNRRRELVKRNLQRKRSPAARLAEGQRRGIPHVSFVETWRPAAKARALKP